MKNFTNKLIAAGMVVFLATAACVTAQECYTPIEWIPKNYVSKLDRNKNFVDDEIEQMDGSSTVDIIVCLNSCFSDTDIEILAESSGLQPVYRSPYISILLFEDVPVDDAIALGKHERVAMVEMAREATGGNDVAARAARIRSSTTYANANVDDVYPTIDGSGVNIAIIDTGVDNVPAAGGPGHESFPSWKIVAGYNALTNVETDPDDDHGHGTHVAGIALGTGGLSGTYRGNAPGARLIDIKAGNMNNAFPTLALTRAFDKLIQRRTAWGIHVANLSVYFSMNNSAGDDALSQHINRVVREGIVMVLIAGNNGNSGTGNFIGNMAASDFAITVASAYDQGTNTRVDDVLSSYSSRGPRLNDGDGMTTDEQKPDVTAYGELINSAQHNTTSGYLNFNGTSMASPQVAGLAARILEANPGMDPLSVKNLIETTADDYGPAGWDVGFGHGIINGYTAINQLISTQKTDVAFSVYCSRPGNSPPWWLSPDIVLTSPNVVEGTSNPINVVIRNNGPNTAYNVKVRVGIYNFSNSTADFDICLRNIPPLAAGATYSFPVPCPWVPEANGLTPPVVHACLKAYIIYNNDSDPSNNCAQRNVNIQQTHSPAVFNMTVVNPTGKNMEMAIETDPSEDDLKKLGWEIRMSDRNFTMSPIDCPKTVTIEMEAVDAAEGDEVPVTIFVRGREEGEGEVLELGGVQIIAQNGNGTPRPPDEVTFKGIRHISLGQARLRSTPSHLFVSEVDGGNDDGVRATLGQADFWQGTLEDFNTDALSDGSSISFTPTGSVNGAPNSTISILRVTDQGDHAQFALELESRPQLTVEVYDDGSLVGADINDDGVFANAWPSLAGMKLTPFRRIGDEAYAEIVFSNNTQIEILGPSGLVVNGDRIVVRCPAADIGEVNYVSHVDIIASDVQEFALTDEAGGAYERPFRSLGNPILEWQNEGQTLHASRATARAAVGARAEVPGLQSYNLFWAETDLDGIATGTHLYVTARGNLPGASDDLGSVWLMRDINDARITASMPPNLAGTYSVEVYSGGGLVYAGGGFGADIGSVYNWPHGGGHAADEATGGLPSFRLYWPGDAEFALADGWAGTGDEIRIIAENGNDVPDGITEVGVFAVGLDELTIVSEEASSWLPVSVDAPTAELPFRLYQNYPNPFDQRTMFRFDLFNAAFVELEIFNLLGEKVADVITQQMVQGTHEVEWKHPASSLPSGTYIYRLKVRPLNSDQTFEMQRQMLILD